MEQPALSSDARLFAVTPDGLLPMPLPEGASSIHDMFDDLPTGVYSALRTFGHDRFLWLDEHLARTVRSMRALDWAYELDVDALCGAIHQACTEYPHDDCRLRFDVTEEPVEVKGADYRVFVGLSPLLPVPPAFRAEGVGLEFAPHLHRDRPKVKTTAFIRERRPLPLGSQECFEHLMLDDDQRVLEGTSSNFFGIVGGTLRTAATGVLEGITRKVVLHLAEELGIPVDQRALHVDELATLDEAFITSSSRLIVPVVTIAGHAVGQGRPGPYCERFVAAFDDFVERTAKPAWPR